MLSLARAFLATGVPAVVQSLWAVEDEPSSELLQIFHRHLRAGADPATALREAQLSFLRRTEADRRDASAWGAFVLVGGGEPLLPIG